MNIYIDLAFLFLFLYFLIRGFEKGFLRSLLGPLSLILGSILSYIYYLKTNNTVAALLLGLFSPLLLQWAMILVIYIWSFSKPKKKNLSILSRISGAMISLIWSGGMVVIFILLIMIMPAGLPYAAQAQDELSKTKTYSLIHYFVQKNPVTLPSSPEEMEQLAKSEEFKKILEDDQFKKIINDPKIQKYIQERNMEGLMRDKDAMSKMTALLNNPETVKTLMELQKKMMSKKAGSGRIDIQNSPEIKTISPEK